jgi:hypothetical protein
MFSPRARLAIPLIAFALALAAPEANPSLFGNFRLAAGGKKLYDAIAATGRVATQGSTSTRAPIAYGRNPHRR